MSSDSENTKFVAHLNALFQAVEEDSYDRAEKGAEQYGALGFLGNDTLQMLYEEMLDGINYLRYTAVKVKLLQEALAEKAAPIEGFVSTSEFLKKGFKPE